MMYIGFLARIALALVFIAASVGKAMHSRAFARTIQRFGIEGDLSKVLAWVLIVYEAILALSLLLGHFVLPTVLAIFLILGIFMGAALRALRLRQKIPCNCFGTTEVPLGVQTLFQAGILACATGIYGISAFGSRTDWWPSTLDASIALFSLVAALILLARWILLLPTIKAIVHLRQTSDATIARRRAQALLPELQEEVNG